MERKKIGILTFWDSNDNYGQQLQCWALQQVLKEMGYEPFLIRYVVAKKKDKLHSSILCQFFKLILVYPVIRNLLWRIKSKKMLELKKRNQERNKMRRFEEFREAQLSLSDKIYYGLRDMQNIPPVADVYICGSDQVWGNLLQDETDDEYTSYFLNFGPSSTKRIAYAASYGMKSYPDAKRHLLRQQLLRFSTISCREKDGVSICSSVGIKSSHVVDPTLLLSSFYYESKLGIKNKVRNNYIYVYSLNIRRPSDLYWNDLKNFALRNNQEIFVTPSSGYYLADEIFDNVNYLYATIPEWIALIRDCDLFVTSSFHGIVFSILFHTPFIYVPVKGKYSIGNNRVLELLEDLQLDSCILKRNYSYQLVNIDWQEVDAILEKMKLSSFDFLRNSLN